IQHGEPGDRVDRLAGRDVAAARPDYDAKLALVVEGFGQGRLDQVRKRAQYRLVATDKCVRPERHGPAALERVLAVVQAEAEDPLWPRHRRAEILGLVLETVPVLQAAGRSEERRVGKECRRGW